MKTIKLMMMTLMMCFYGGLFGQDEYATYENLYDEKIYEIQISFKDSIKYDLYIDMMSLDNLSKFGGIMVNEKQHLVLLSTLNDVKLKYNEWVKTAIDNNVSKLDKTMSYNTKVGAYFQYGREWNFQFIVNLTFDFKITESEYLLIARTGKLTSSSNQYITHDGFVFVFQNDKEINDFINILSVDKVKEFIKKPKATDLFNE